MYSEKHDFHVTNPEPVTAFSIITMKAVQETQMKIKDRIRAAAIWISEKLPCSHPQFQIFYDTEYDSEKEA